MNVTKTPLIDASPNIDVGALKAAMGCFVTGVTVVTTNTHGQDLGMTCNSFNTVSLEPAMVLWSIRKSSSSHKAFTNAGGYTVNVLSMNQQNEALKFTKGDHAQRFLGVPHQRLQTGRLMLTEAVAWFDCQINQVVSAGDHDILIGNVLAFGSKKQKPLAYINGEFAAI